MSGVTISYSIVHRAVSDAHKILMGAGLQGHLPIVNLHSDGNLPLCVYMPNTNALAAYATKIFDMRSDKARAEVLNAMAMCGCERAYQKEMLIWNFSNNKLRLMEPHRHMQGSPKWKEIRELLGD